jgi:bifunctional DNA-binding transcriptional regulator/antitoxin component of YhaV-PrlF toxin-antitoxin module
MSGLQASWYDYMAMTKRLVISRGGQVSVPAAVRKRWGARAVLAEDMGDKLVLRPAPDDPIAAVRGIFAQEMNGGPTTDELRTGARREGAELERRRG